MLRNNLYFPVSFCLLLGFICQVQVAQGEASADAATAAAPVSESKAAESKSPEQKSTEQQFTEQAAADNAQPEAKQDAKKTEKSQPAKQKRIIGATATLIEKKSGISFPARIDTGATSCSINVEKWEIKNESKDRSKNIGKPIRFLLSDGNGKKGWVKGKVVSTVIVKTSDNTERRYKVLLTLKRGDFEKRIRVSLNDRSHMEYPLLIGRNFLSGDWLVDVSLNQNAGSSKQQQAKTDDNGKADEPEEEIDQEAETSKVAEREEERQALVNEEGS